MIDWNSKSTAHLKLILESLERYRGNARTDREKRNSANSISKIKNILKGRNK